VPRTLKDQLEAEIADAETHEAEKPGLHHGTDWWQLSDAEEEVFRIDRQRFPRMVMTWHCYEAFKLISGSPTWDEALIEQARQQHPEWCGEGVDEQEFFRFAKEFGGLSYREAHAVYAKHDFWTVRLGIVRYADERKEKTP
jgi:hypothetical protein